MSHPRPDWSPRTTRWVLGVLCVCVVSVGLMAYAQMPLPPHSSHDAFTLIPQLQKLLLGMSPDEARFGTFEATWFSQHAEPLSPGGARAWVARLFSNVQSHTWIDAPHPIALASLLAVLVPGRPVMATLVFSGYFVLLLVALASIGTRVSSRRVGVLAAVIAAGCPALFGTARYLEPHLPVAAMATVVVALLLHSDSLRRPGVCLGISLAAWSLTRTGEGSGEVVIGGLLVAGPGLWALVQSRSTPWRRWLLGFGCLVLPFVILADFSWLAAAMERVTRAFADPVVQTDVAEEGGLLGSPWAWKGAYLVLMGTDYLRPLLAVALVIAAFGWRAAVVRQRVIVVLWLVVPLICLSWMQRKASWYGIGLVPPIALWMAIGLDALARRWLVGLVGTVAVVQLFAFSLWPVEAFSGAAAWLREPLPMHDWRMRRMDLLRPMGDAADQRVYADLDAVVRWLNAHHPPGDAPLQVAMATMGSRHDYAARYWIETRRPDVQVINLSDPRVRSRRYRNLLPDDFVAFFFLDGGLSPWPPDLTQRAWLADNLRCAADDPLDLFVAALQERGLVEAEGVLIYGFRGRVGQGFTGGRIWAGFEGGHVQVEAPLCGP